MHCLRLARRLGRDRRGSTAIEYALIAAVASIAAMAGLRAFADGSAGLYAFVTSTLKAAMGG
jgi:Flp pilus assembly pilin Flp